MPSFPRAAKQVTPNLKGLHHLLNRNFYWHIVLLTSVFELYVTEAYVNAWMTSNGEISGKSEIDGRRGMQCAVNCHEICRNFIPQDTVFIPAWDTCSWVLIWPQYSPKGVPNSVTFEVCPRVPLQLWYWLVHIRCPEDTWRVSRDPIRFSESD